MVPTLAQLVAVSLYFTIVGGLFMFWIDHKKVGRQITHKWDYVIWLVVVMLVVATVAAGYLVTKG